MLYTVSWALAMLAGTAGAMMSDRTTFYLTARIAEQLHAVSGVDHLERPAYLTELELLQQNLRLLGNGPRQILLVVQVLVRTVGIVIILAVIFPPLAVLPLAAAAPIIGERLSVWLRQRSDERLAPDRRLANELFELATSAGPAKELRVFGAAGTLQERHRALARQINAGTTRAAVLGGLLRRGRLAGLRGRVRGRDRRRGGARGARDGRRRRGGAGRHAGPAGPAAGRPGRGRHRPAADDDADGAAAAVAGGLRGGRPPGAAAFRPGRLGGGAGPGQRRPTASRRPCCSGASPCGRSASATRRTGGWCLTAWTWTCRPERRWPWSARTGQARPPWSSC